MNTPFGPWRYRRSLASRVILLTTIAVGVSVALVALASYLTVRHQILSALDESLHRRAYAAAAYSPSEVRMGDLPAFLQGATDSSVGYVFANGRVVMTRGPDGATVQPGGPEFAVANGASKFSCRTITATCTASRDDSVLVPSSKSLARTTSSSSTATTSSTTPSNTSNAGAMASRRLIAT